MNKIALITDSTCDLPKDIIEKYHVRVLPFRVVYKDRDYMDGVEITPQEVYERLPIEIPTSSMPSMKDISELYENLITEGYTHAVFVTLSTGLSGIQNAIQIVSEDYPQIESFIYDSKSISMGEGFLVIACGEMIQQGKSFEEITTTLPKIRERIHLFFVVGTLEYLKKGGRIGRVVGTISEILRIKPIISVGEDGKYFTYDKVRGRKQSLQRMFNIAKEILEEKKCRLYVMSGAAKDEAKAMLEKLSHLPNVISAEYGGDISPVSGVHSGPGLVGVLMIEEGQFV